jgi:hypothetical protein
MKRLDRKKPSRTPKRRFYLVCEGTNTEPQYFAAVATLPEAATVEISTLRGVGDPSNIAKTAEKITKSRELFNHFERNDEVWAIFDRDEHAHYDQAVRVCEAKGIGVAYSNPCFELWLILHYQCHNSPDDRHTVQKKFEALDSQYNASRGKVCNFDKLCAKIGDAEENAKKLANWREAEGSGGGAPSTTVHLLTMKLRGIID